MTGNIKDIFDQVFREGGTLHVWLGGCRFGRIEGVGEGVPNVMRVYDRRTSEWVLEYGDDGKPSAVFSTALKSRILKFSPSPDLMAKMKRHASELKSHCDRLVADWLAEAARGMTPRGLGSSGPKSGAHPNGRGGDGWDCNGAKGASISPAGGVGSGTGGRGEAAGRSVPTSGGQSATADEIRAASAAKEAAEHRTNYKL